jgi:hypothetical protein
LKQLVDEVHNYVLNFSFTIKIPHNKNPTLGRWGDIWFFQTESKRLYDQKVIYISMMGSIISIYVLTHKLINDMNNHLVVLIDTITWFSLSKVLRSWKLHVGRNMAYKMIYAYLACSMFCITKIHLTMLHFQDNFQTNYNWFSCNNLF